MKPPRDGGPAFPVAEIRAGEIGVKPPEDGMSLRDYFAAAALQGFAANPTTDAVAAKIACAAYHVADALLAERAKAGA